jgi:hypothetical protein
MNSSQVLLWPPGIKRWCYYTTNKHNENVIFFNDYLSSFYFFVNRLPTVEKPARTGRCLRRIDGHSQTDIRREAAQHRWWVKRANLLYDTTCSSPELLTKVFFLIIISSSYKQSANEIDHVWYPVNSTGSNVVAVFFWEWCSSLWIISSVFIRSSWCLLVGNRETYTGVLKQYYI